MKNLIKKYKKVLDRKRISNEITKKPHLFILGILLITGFIFAFYNFENRYVLEDETVREAIIAIEGARQKQVPLVGAFSSAAPFTWGPWFYYQIIAFSLIFPSFYSPWIYLGLAYLGSILLLYKIGVYLENKDFGIILAALGTFSPALIIGATHLTFPNLITFFALLSVLLFIKIIKKDVSYWWAFLFGIILGIGINVHYQAASLLILPLIMPFYKRKKIFYFLSFLAGSFLTFIPLIIFDLTNHWFNTKNILYFYLYGKDLIYVPNRWLFYVRDFWPAYWGDVIGVSNVVAFTFMALTSFILLYQLYKKRLSIPLLLIAIAFFIDFVVMRYYWGERFFGYFNFLRPFIFIFSGYIFYFSYKEFKKLKVVWFFAFFALMLIIAPKSIDRLKGSAFNEDIYKRVSSLEKIHPDKKFTLYICEDLYKGNDQRIPKSILYILEKDGKTNDDAFKIGVEKEACVKKATKNKVITKEGQIIANERNFPQIGNLDIYDFSKADEEFLKKAGWRKITFRTYYDETTRWWFNEQP